MDHSPRKRITRSKAAAKAAEKSSKTNKNLTTTSKAGILNKRKTGADETEDSSKTSVQESLPLKPKMTRGRIKKSREDEAEVKVQTVESISTRKPTRGRPRKTPNELNAPEPTRNLRGKSNKSITNEKQKVTTQERPPTRSRGQISNVPTNFESKKIIKFGEPDKENIIPSSKQNINPKNEEAHTGLRAKPMRKPGSIRAARSHRSAVRVVQRTSPLIKPKKSIALNILKEYSDDELALNSTKISEIKMCSPCKPAGSTSCTKENHYTSNATISLSVSNEGQDLKTSIMSPARRPPSSPFKDGMKMSPQKISNGNVMRQSTHNISGQTLVTKETNTMPVTPILLSPAKRPHSPVRSFVKDQPFRSIKKESLVSATLSDDLSKISRFTTPIKNGIIGKNVGELSHLKHDTVSLEEPNQINIHLDDCPSPDPELTFSGRLSSITPRDLDHALVSDSLPHDIEAASTSLHDEFCPTDLMNRKQNMVATCHDNEEMHLDGEDSNSNFPYQNNCDVYAYRREENHYQDSDSEDELAFNPILNSYSILSPDMKLPSTTPHSKGVISSQENQGIGFTPLAQQLSYWMASSPEKLNKSSSLSEIEESTAENDNVEAKIVTSTQGPSSDDDINEGINCNLISSSSPSSKKPDLICTEIEPVEIDPQDLELALEANEMSLLDPSQVDVPENDFFPPNLTDQNLSDYPSTVSRTVDRTDFRHDTAIEILETEVSEDNQEGPEDSDTIINPQLLELPAPYNEYSCATPKRIISRTTYHTVCKVPLKPISDDTPVRPLPKKSASIFRLHASRPSFLINEDHAALPLTKDTLMSPENTTQSLAAQEMMLSPSKQVFNWPATGTPARSPHHNLNKSLLKGAVVFVDVYTTEGADASFIFIEVLTQMGARCVKSWNWNGVDDGKIGITHVIFKDGGKRTLEKVRDSDGLVTCIGVGWVLE